jgi:Phage gp6-like head-tail connector protein
MSREYISNLAIITPPSEEPIALALAKLHLRVTTAVDDLLITNLIASARSLAEKETRRAFVTRTYELRLNRFPYYTPIFALNPLTYERQPAGTDGQIWLPKPPLIAVNSLTYIDVNGATQTLDPSRYEVDSGGVLQGSLTPSFGNYFPQSRFQLNAIRINYDAGYGAASDVPEALIQAMLLQVGHWYRNREATTDQDLKELILGAKALASPFKWGSYG